jgi:hypothetical protein
MEGKCQASVFETVIAKSMTFKIGLLRLVLVHQGCDVINRYESI